MSDVKNFSARISRSDTLHIFACVATLLLSHHVLFNFAMYTYIHLLIKYLDSQQPLVIKQKEKEINANADPYLQYFRYINLILKSHIKISY